MPRVQSFQLLILIAGSVAVMSVLPVMADSLSTLSPIDSDYHYSAPVQVVGAGGDTKHAPNSNHQLLRSASAAQENKPTR